MQIRARALTRRLVVAAAGLGMAAGVVTNLPAHAAASAACPQLVASYLANPAAQATLLPFLLANDCSIPTSSTSSSSSSSSSSTSSSSTTSTTANPAISACAPLSANYLANPGARAQLLPLFAQFGCRVPTIPTSSTSSSSTSSTSSTSTTSTTVTPNTSICAALLSAFVSNPAAQQSLLPVLAANNCGIGVTAGA